MEFTRPVSQLIPTRISVRTYDSRKISREDLSALDSCGSEICAPFGSDLAFRVVHLPDLEEGYLASLGTYGVIRGASYYLLASVKESLNALVDFGYAFELMVLKAHDLGLGTCWLGGTFTRSAFAELLGVRPNHIVPCISSLGHYNPSMPMRDRAIRILARSSKRLPWEKIFFHSDLKHPLREETVPKYAVPLEMLRLAPSASNRQPWRIIYDAGIFHFYRYRSSMYLAGMRLTKIPDLQLVDMGIAMAHFELSAQEVGITGAFETMRERKEFKGMDYVVSYKEEI
ncbi:nitroreductase family protein [Myxococcota bacterium]|nr:nitroreductase family protein [Myxococcota bacterium]MBU1536995.1 nitroreductase family protein [Myxococcota bacterium]